MKTSIDTFTPVPIPGSEPLQGLSETFARLAACQILGSLPEIPETRRRTLYLMMQFYGSVFHDDAAFAKDGEALQ